MVNGRKERCPVFRIPIPMNPPARDLANEHPAGLCGVWCVCLSLSQLSALSCHAHRPTRPRNKPERAATNNTTTPNAAFTKPLHPANTY